MGARSGFALRTLVFCFESIIYRQKGQGSRFATKVSYAFVSMTYQQKHRKLVEGIFGGQTGELTGSALEAERQNGPVSASTLVT